MNIDWRKTLMGFALFLAMLGISAWLMRPTDEELAARKNAQPAVAHNLPQERVQFTFDDRPWGLVKEIRQDGKYSAEYTLQGDTLPGWKELVTIQTFSGLQDKGTPEEFAAAMEKHIKDWGKEKVRWKVLAANDTELIYEWQVTGQENFTDQYEICRIIKGSQGFHLVHYATRLPLTDAGQREVWMKKLLTAKLVQ